ncbi:hypothetical protein [Streptomyces sp. T028]|uniref:hypothetical protein n=1 Tax=Streptomyces sp. T028 TaxID=3394379 RepID=UPI003A8834D2
MADLPAETEFWSRFAGLRWESRAREAAWGTVPSPVPETRCRLLIVPAHGEPAPGHAMNDAGFPSMGVFSTAIDTDCAKAVTAGAKLRAEPITTSVGGRPVRMALIETPVGTPVGLLTVIKSGQRE